MAEPENERWVLRCTPSFSSDENPSKPKLQLVEVDVFRNQPQPVETFPRHVPEIQLSSVQNPGWLFYIGDYTTQLYRDYNKPL